jgi:hypothetical protein
VKPLFARPRGRWFWQGHIARRGQRLSESMILGIDALRSIWRSVIDDVAI